MTAAQRPAWQRAIITLSAVVVGTILITLLYVGRVVLIPIAMAIFFTYVLSPVVSFGMRRGMPRPAAVIITVVVAVAIFLTGSFLVTRELSSLTSTVAANGPMITAKIKDAKTTIFGTGDSPLTKLIDDLGREVDPPTGEDRVVVEPRRSLLAPSMEQVAGPVLEAIALAGFSFILVVFMLLAKTDLADRVLRLIGDGQVTVTTRAMNDASTRISKYLFRQLVVNSAFGIFVAITLYSIGLSYALLWGVLIAVMRYVPYIGTWIGVIPPTLFAFAIDADWNLAIATFTIVVGSELLVNNFLEPRIYGASLGVSEVAQLISAALWSFLWGPVGLVLSGPITTCLLVLGRHAPPFRFLEVLLGNEPPLTPGLALHQRFAAHDQDEALRCVRAATPAEEPYRVYDEAFVPALVLVKTARGEGHLDVDDEKQVGRIAREILDETIDDLRTEPTGREAFKQRIRLMACPAQDDFDRLTLDMLVSQLPLARWEVRLTAVATLTAELLTDAAAFDPQVIVIASLPPGGAAHARYLCKRLRARFPAAHILVGRWGETSVDAAAWVEAGANTTDNNIAHAVQHLNAWEPVFNHEETPVLK